VVVEGKICRRLRGQVPDPIGREAGPTAVAVAAIAAAGRGLRAPVGSINRGRAPDVQ
jgi:hypothetical protein